MVGKSSFMGRDEVVPDAPKGQGPPISTTKRSKKNGPLDR